MKPSQKPLCRIAPLGALALALFLASCTTVQKPEEPARPRGPVFEEAAFSGLPRTDDADWENALKSFRTSCRVMKNRSPWTGACRAAEGVGEKEARRFFEENFTPWRVLKDSTKDGSTGLMTGYYEPLLSGSRTKGAPYLHPVYGVPDDLLIVDLAEVYPKLKGLRLRGKLEGRRVVPYDSRAGIQARTDMDRWAIAWVDDPVESFFLQIQGSGRIRLPDGSFVRVGFADQNGHSYHAIGKWLVEKEAFKPHELSMQRIKAWARANPDKVDEALAQNPSYVFFQERSGDPSEGPIGSQGVPLTPLASVAVDHREWRLGTPFVVAARQENPALAFARPVVAQDTGGAIRGLLRFDYFWGFGDAAGQSAGRQKSEAAAWVLVPRGFSPEDVRPKK